MKDRTTHILLAAIALLLLAHLVRSAATSSSAQGQQVEKAHAVLRAQAIELVDKKGQSSGNCTSAKTAAAICGCAAAMAWCV